MKVTIFNVKHGACALVECDDRSMVMIDCGSHSDLDWNPGDYLREREVDRLDALIITNYDEDHVRGLPNLLSTVKVDTLYRNTSVSPDDLTKLKSETGAGAGITRLIEMAKRYSQNPQTGAGNALPNLKIKTFRNSYPAFEDENNLSLVTYIEAHGVGFLFPGDLEAAGWKALLESNKSLREAVKKVHILVASHHGRQSGVYEPLFDTYGCKPIHIVISDRDYVYESQRTVPYYASKCSGAYVGTEGRRYVLTTRNDGSISFDCTLGLFTVGLHQDK